MKAIRSQTIEEVMLILEEAKIEQPWKNLVNDKLETNTNRGGGLQRENFN